MSIKSRIFATFLLVVLLSCTNNKLPQQLAEKEIVEQGLGKQVDSLLTPFVVKLREATDNTAGLAIGITKGEQIIYARTFGFSSVEKGIEANLNTVFHIASVSKPFTAVAVVKLVQQGKLKLDDKIIDYIPEFRMKGDSYKNITIKQILTHTSGIPRHVTIDDWNNPVYGPEAPLKNLTQAANFELDFEPGSQYSYSNSAIDILGIVISRASGLTFEEYLTKHVLLPSGMTETFYLKPKDSLPDNWADAHSYGLQTQKWSPFPYTENYFPSGGVHASLMDMCNWGMMHVGQGSFKEYEVLDKDHFNLLLTPYAETSWGDKVGLSWFLKSYLDRPVILHTGNDSGFEAQMIIYPEEDVSISVMVNRDYGRSARIANAAAEALFGVEIKDYDVSAIYGFAEKYNSEGIDAARTYWEEMGRDTTDSFYVNNGGLLSAGAVLEVNKNWKEATDLLEYYLTLNEKSTYAWRLLGNASLNLGDTTRAMNCYQKTLEINPNYEKGEIALDKLLSELNNGG